MALNQLSIYNFQAIKKLELPLGPITVIMGDSDTGKSAAIRALMWLATNRPGGDDFINHDATDAVVVVEKDGHTMKREKGAHGNLYYLDDKELKAFGSDVPADVAGILQLSDINFQTQHVSDDQSDPLFWFGNTSGEVSRQLNQIINLGKIDTTLGRVNAKIRETQSLVTVGGARLEAARAVRDSHKIAEDMDADLALLEKQQKENAALAARIARLTVALREASGIALAIKTTKRTQTAAKAVILAGDAHAEARKSAETLSKLLETAKVLQKRTKKTLPSVDHLSEMWATHQKQVAAVVSLSNLIAEASKARRQRTEWKQKGRDAHSQFEALLGEECPLCGKTT